MDSVSSGFFRASCSSSSSSGSSSSFSAFPFGFFSFFAGFFSFGGAFFGFFAGSFSRFSSSAGFGVGFSGAGFFTEAFAADGAAAAGLEAGFRTAGLAPLGGVAFVVALAAGFGEGFGAAFSGVTGAAGDSSTRTFFAFLAGFDGSSVTFGFSSTIPLRLLGLARDVDAVLEHARVEPSDLRRLLDVRRRLPDLLHVRAREEDLVPLDDDLRLAEDRGAARRLLPEEVLDDELAPLHNRLHREVRVHDLHLVREARRDADDHVPDVRGERADDRLLPAARQVGADPQLPAVEGEGDARGREPTLQGPELPGDAVDPAAAIVDAVERADVIGLLHHVEDVAHELRGGPERALALPRELRVLDHRHRIVEWILKHHVT